MHFLARPVTLTGLILLGLLAAGCTPLSMTPGTPPASELTPEPGKVTVAEVRARPAPLSGGTGAAYMIVLNGFDMPVRLTSASGDVAAAIELHETVNEDGVMKMIPRPEGFEIPAGGSIELKPGGKHIMMIDLISPLEVGQEFRLTLSFDNDETLAITVPVMEMDMSMPMEDGAMNHGNMAGSESGSMEATTPETDRATDKDVLPAG